MAVVQLTIPIPDRDANPTTQTNTKRLAKWISELPVANPLGTAKLFNNALSLLNRHPDPIDNRFELMLCYLPTFTDFLSTYIGFSKQQSSNNLSRREREQQQLTETITTEMAYGFKRVLNDSEQLQKGGYKPEIQALIVYYTVECLTLSLMYFFSQYKEEPRNTFKEITQLYLLAEGLNISKISIDRRLYHTDEPANVRMSYKRILLLQLLDPSHLPRGEIWHAYDYLAKWASESRITKVPEQIENFSGRFLMSLTGNEKPIPYSPVIVRENRDDFLLLDAIPLNTVINKQMQSQSETSSSELSGYGSATDTPTASLFRHMLLAWHIRPKRRHNRDDKHQWVVAAAGVDQVNHFLKHQRLNKDADNLIGSHSDVGNKPDEVKITESIAGPSSSNYNTFRWRQINTSVSGAALVTHPNEQNNLHIGQLIIMEDEHSTESSGLTVGVVRRVVQRGSSTLEAGVQFIQGKLTVATLRPVAFGADGLADFQPALYLDRGPDNPGTLLTPHPLYQRDREYVIRLDDGEDQRVFADQLLESSRYYDRFEFRLTHSQEE